MMKKLLFLLLILTGCETQEDASECYDNGKVDSLIKKSDIAISNSDSNNKIVDSVTTEVISRTTENFETLTKEIEKVKKVQKEKIIVRIDTIYIESKKNFFGRTKTKVKTTSSIDSTQLVTDSTE